MISLTCHTCHTACPLNSLMRNSFFCERADVRLCYPLLLRRWCMGFTEQVCKFIYCKWRSLTGFQTGIGCYGNPNVVAARHRGGITDTSSCAVFQMNVTSTPCFCRVVSFSFVFLLKRTLQDQQAKKKKCKANQKKWLYIGKSWRCLSMGESFWWSVTLHQKENT